MSTPIDTDGFDKAFHAVWASVEQVLGQTRKDERLDNWCHNFGIAAAVMFGAIGTGIPPGDWGTPISKILTGAATAIFAIERSLEFGSRWLFNRRLRHQYGRVLTRLSLIQSLPDLTAKRNALDKAVEEMEKIGDWAANMPGVELSRHRA